MSDLIKREDAIKIVDSYIGTDPISDRIRLLPSARPQGELIGKADAIAYIDRVTNSGLGRKKSLEYIRKYIVALPSAEAEWIPCNKQMPDELEAVNITWVNHNPPPYYKYTKDVPLVDTAVYYKGAWYWWDATVIDLLGEYDGAYIHGIEPIDKDIEVVAWMPLPTPYREENEE